MIQIEDCLLGMLLPGAQPVTKPGLIYWRKKGYLERPWQGLPGESEVNTEVSTAGHRKALKDKTSHKGKRHEGESPNLNTS